VFNGGIGQIVKFDPVERGVTIRFELNGFWMPAFLTQPDVSIHYIHLL
jgi:hypothetical protein